jgi:hypothetical protein
VNILLATPESRPRRLAFFVDLLRLPKAMFKGRVKIFIVAVASMSISLV